MKCEELKTETIVPQGTTITLQMYPKGEVNAAIAELKDDNRKLKRALWLARAERAKSAAMFWDAEWTNEPNGSNDVYDIDFNVLTDKLKRRCFDWCKIFEEVERKCRAKAEEYK